MEIPLCKEKKIVSTALSLEEKSKLQPCIFREVFVSRFIYVCLFFCLFYFLFFDYDADTLIRENTYTNSGFKIFIQRTY